MSKGTYEFIFYLAIIAGIVRGFLDFIAYLKDERQD